MKSVFVLLVVCVGCVVAFVPPPPGPYGPTPSPYGPGPTPYPYGPPPCACTSDVTPERQFSEFKRTFGRRYNAEEEKQRFACFQQNMDLIAKRNSEDPSAMHGVNQFADLCPTEFAQLYLGYRPSNNTAKRSTEVVPTVGACSSVDWRKSGIVTPVKNQGQCGSCWSFSATGNMEGQWAKHKGQLVSLSEEELVQCSGSAGNQGCNGGLMDQAFEWVIKNGGIDSETNYPYTSGGGVTGSCKHSKEKSIVASFSSYKDLPNDEKQMAAWVCENGPLSIAVDALSWQTYTGGVVTKCGGTTLDHGVLIVGFDESASPPYWIIKNSWGASWGESGYIRVEMFKNECGLDQSPSSIAV